MTYRNLRPIKIVLRTPAFLPTPFLTVRAQERADSTNDENPINSNAVHFYFTGNFGTALVAPISERSALWFSANSANIDVDVNRIEIKTEHSVVEG